MHLVLENLCKFPRSSYIPQLGFLSFGSLNMIQTLEEICTAQFPLALQ